jgi:hypothetical protein
MRYQYLRSVGKAHLCNLTGETFQALKEDLDIHLFPPVPHQLLKKIIFWHHSSQGSVTTQATSMQSCQPHVNKLSATTSINSVAVSSQD